METTSAAAAATPEKRDTGNEVKNVAGNLDSVRLRLLSKSPLAYPSPRHAENSSSRRVRYEKKGVERHEGDRARVVHHLI